MLDLCECVIVEHSEVAYSDVEERLGRCADGLCSLEGFPQLRLTNLRDCLSEDDVLDERYLSGGRPLSRPLLPDSRQQRRASCVALKHGEGDFRGPNPMEEDARANFGLRSKVE